MQLIGRICASSSICSGPFSAAQLVLQPREGYWFCTSWTRSGHFQLSVFLQSIQPGFSATYYSLMNMSSPKLSLSVGSVSQPADLLLQASFPAEQAFSMRWAGVVRPDYAQIYTFSGDLSRQDQRLRLWIDKTVLVDMWQNISTLHGSGTVYFESTGNYYDLLLEYKQFAGPFQFGLSWSSFPFVLASNQLINLPLFCRNSDLVSRSFDLIVLPGVLCGLTSGFRGPGLTIASAGQITKFTIIPRDKFWNQIYVDHIRVLITMNETNNTGAVLNTTQNESREHEACYIPVQAGPQSLQVAVLEAGGLWATYYAGNQFETPVITVWETNVSHNWMVSSPGFGLGRDFFSIRWSGYLMTPSFEEHFLSFRGVQDNQLSDFAADCVSMAINNSDIYRSCTSKSAPASIHSNLVVFESSNFTSLSLEYQSTVGGAACSLTWSKTRVDNSVLTIPSSVLWGSTNLGKPMLLSVYAGSPILQQCNVTGLTIQTAGIVSTFQIRCSDGYANPVSVANAVYYRRSLGFAGIFLAATDSGNAVSSIAILQLKSGHFMDQILQLIPGGIWATYYDGVGFGPFDSRMTRFQENLSVNINVLAASMSGISGGIRLAGFWNASNFQPFALNTSLSGSDERIKLWWDTMLVIDQWTSLGAMSPIGLLINTFSTECKQCNSMHEIRIEYKQYLGDFGFNITASSAATSNSMQIQSSQLCAANSLEGNNPDLFTMNGVPTFVQPTVPCGSMCSLSGSGISIATVGLPASFVLHCTDQFLNPLDTYPIGFVLKSSRGLGQCVLGNRTKSGDLMVSYVPTLKGIYDVSACIIAQNGIQATYFSGVDLRYPNFTALQASIDFSNSGLSGSFPVNVPYSIRWAGFVKPAFAQIYTVYASVLGVDERIRIWIESSLVVDMWKTLSWTSGSGTMEFNTANGYYEIVVEYQQTSGNAGAELKWATDSLVAPVDLVFSGTQSVNEHFGLGSLFTCPDVKTSIQMITVQADAESSCLGYILSGDGISVSTAGLLAEFILSVQDPYLDTTRTVPVMGISSSMDQKVETKLFHLGQYSNGSYTFNYSQTMSGEYSLTVGNAVSGGLVATYYDNMHFSEPNVYSSKVVLNQILDHEWNDSWPIYSDSVMSTNSYISVRWKGLISPPLSALYTFLAITGKGNVSAEAQCGTCFEASRVILAGNTVVDTWSSPSNSGKGSIYLQSGILYDIEVMYRHYKGVATFKLFWMSSLIRLSIVPSSSLLRLPCLMSQQSLQVSVRSDVVSVDTSNLSMSLSIITAGTYAILSIWPKDRFGNDCSGGNGLGVQFFAERVGTPPIQIAVNATGFSETSEWQAPFILTNSGAHTLAATLVNSGGLQATYYSTDNFSVPLYSRIEALLDFSVGSAQGPVSTIAIGVPFSVRWSGFVRSKTAQLYTIYAAVIGTDERVRVWIDNLLLIDMWQNITGTQGSGTVSFDVSNGYYNIFVEYKQYSGSSGARLSWSTGSLTLSAIPSPQLFSGNKQGPRMTMMVMIYPGPISRNSTARGYGLTAATAGLQAHFLVLSRDQFGNAVQPTDKNIFTSHLYLADTLFDVSSEITATGEISVMYTLHCGSQIGSLGVLLHAALHISGSPWQLSVSQANYCSALTYAFGTGLSIGTAGLFQEIRVLARDSYGNVRNFSQDQQTPYVASICVYTQPVTHTNSFACSSLWALVYRMQGIWYSSIAITKSGIYQFNILQLTGTRLIYHSFFFEFC